MHGGEHQAAYVYPIEHFEHWRQKLGWEQMPPGIFGENLTTSGLLETEVGVGDVLRIGGAVVQVTLPRLPCFGLAHKIGRPDLLKEFLHSGHSGFYLRVLTEGEVGAGDEIAFVERDPAASASARCSGLQRLQEGDAAQFAAGAGRSFPCSDSASGIGKAPRRHLKLCRQVRGYGPELAGNHEQIARAPCLIALMNLTIVSPGRAQPLDRVGPPDGHRGHHPAVQIRHRRLQLGALRLDETHDPRRRPRAGEQTRLRPEIPFTLARLAAWDDPAPGDIVVFFSPKDGMRLVKRVIAGPGDTVEMRDDVLFLNGQKLDYTPAGTHPFGPEIYEDPRPLIAKEAHPGQEHWVMALPSRPAMRSFPVVTVPAGSYFMMGDSRDNSLDSRFFGVVERRQIVGKAGRVLLSLDKNRHYVPRLRRSLSPLDE